MPGTKDGGKAAARKNKKLYGSDFYAKIGAMGGSAPHKTRFFRENPTAARLAGTIGGKMSIRGTYRSDEERKKLRKKYQTDFNRYYRELERIKQKADRQRAKVVA